ncbi:hypothetical protein BH11MYX1_BH11MYX1_18240 [soil metagenome]
MRLGAVVAAVASAVLACKPGPPSRLFTDDELAASEKDLRHRLDANARQACAPELVTLAERGAGHAEYERLIIAAQRSGGCSPYQVGARREPTEPMAAELVAGQIASRLATIATEDRGRAAILAGQALRFYQDLSRGHTSLHLRLVTAAATRIIGEALAPILVKLSADQAGELAATLDQLIASYPPLGETLEGERERLESIPPAGPHFGDPRDEVALQFAVGSELVRRCPPTADLTSCARPWDRPRPPPVDLGMVAARLQHGDDPAPLRRALTTSLAAMYPVAAQARRLAVEVAQLAELRIHAEVVRTGHCPSEAELRVTPFSRLLAPAALGAALGAHRVNLGMGLEVTPPPWAASPTICSIPCP